MAQEKPVKSRPMMHTEVSTKRPKGRLGRDVQNKIGQQLRAMYEDVVKEGIPDRFERLLKRLDKDPDKDRS